MPLYAPPLNTLYTKQTHFTTCTQKLVANLPPFTTLTATGTFPCIVISIIMDDTASTTNPPEAEEQFYEAETDTPTAAATTTTTSAEEEFLQEAAALLPGELVDKMTLLEHHVPGGEDEEEEEGGGQNAVHAQEMKEKGNELYQAQDFEGALDCYSRAIKACPYQYDKEKELAAARRKMLLRREDEEAAEEEARKRNNNESTKAAAAGAPEEAAAGGGAADDESNDKGKENVEAEAATTVATTKKEDAAEPEPEPEEPFAKYKEDCAVYYCNRAACLVALKRSDEEVVEDCTIALKLKPGYLKALLRRAQAWERLDKLEDTLKDYKEVLQVDPTNRLARSKIPGLEKQCAVRMEKLKDETLGKLKELGNSVLSNFGLSLDNFKMQQDPNTGSYSISFQN